MKNYLKPLLFLHILIIQISCSSDDVKQNNDNRELKGLFNDRREQIREEVKIHSEGLEYFYNNAEVGYNLSEKENIDILKNTLTKFLSPKNISTETLGLIDEKLQGKNLTIPLKNYNFKFSENFYIIANSILDVEGNSIESIKQNIDYILNSKDFIALNYIEKDIIYLGAETYIDSYIYWEKNMSKWDKKFNIKTEQSPKDKTTFGWWDRTKQYAKADGKGAVAGGIGGAIGGAVVGAFAGGVGAVPGAVAGGVGGAIGTGITNSILEAWGYVSIDDKYSNIGGVIVPDMWLNLTIEKESYIENIKEIKIKENDFILIKK